VDVRNKCLVAYQDTFEISMRLVLPTSLLKWEVTHPEQHSRVHNSAVQVALAVGFFKSWSMGEACQQFCCAFLFI
jgi:hypothetical protein